jgi:hypothetical protein
MNPKSNDNFTEPVLTNFKSDLLLSTNNKKGGYAK